MSIKKMDASMLDKIMSGTYDSKQNNSDSISEEELHELYELGMEEINKIETMLAVMKIGIASSAFAPIFLTSDFVNDFMYYMEFVCEDMFPKLLKGDFNGIMEEISSDSDFDENQFNEMREKAYQLLLQRKREEE